MKPLSKFTNFVFSAGGMGGFCFAGTLISLIHLSAINHMNFYDQVNGVAGCSIGSAISFFVCLKLTIPELIEVMNYDLIKLFKPTFDYKNIFTTFGGLNILTARPIFEQLLVKSNMKKRITFKEFYEKTGILLKITVTNLTKRSAEYHSKDTTPNFIVVDSLLASMAIPGVFAPVYINDQCYIDGAVVDSFPIDQFDRNTTLGFCLKRSNPRLDEFKSYFFSIFTLCTKRCINVNCNTIPISTGSISRMDPCLSHTDKNTLISNGVLSTLSYFEQDLKCKFIALQFIKLILMIGHLKLTFSNQ